MKETFKKIWNWVKAVLFPIICASAGTLYVADNNAAPTVYEQSESEFKTYTVHVLEKIPISGIKEIESFTKNYVFSTTRSDFPNEAFIHETVRKLGATGEIQIAAITTHPNKLE